ncbi:hypothetical protein [Actinosynnema mirum]|uniref:Uncharacterized protein n=1 Tax=Actinosynnema mirum (strain ATCC 29888 / DSM 43827 / JCM 3225 / NBRC 14064 / NCIMB 13271 / NRRL B-12336 / IMRU 3971 / 101) TaxID=446462 RepID=C6WQ10_ACTMD|nr:hypothetical protein [Actinosynnema mirum]ACU35066.1 hypothetical protein Amir_1110 [Actinosynnema mirum DSM 43827]
MSESKEKIRNTMTTLNNASSEHGYVITCDSQAVFRQIDARLMCPVTVWEREAVWELLKQEWAVIHPHSQVMSYGTLRTQVQLMLPTEEGLEALAWWLMVTKTDRVGGEG